MFSERHTSSKATLSCALGVLILVVGLWIPPAIAGASDTVSELPLSASINVPLNQIKEGQNCVAYANVYGATGTVHYLWGGTYYLGKTTQVVDADMWGENGYVTLKVWDDNDTVWAPTENLQVESGFAYNGDCEG